MIEKYFADELKILYPDWNISEDYFEAADNIIAIYNEGGNGADPANETNPLYPDFMIWLSSSNWETVKKIAYEVYKHFHNIRNIRVTNYDNVTFQVNMIVADSFPNRIGIEDGKMQYSINFSTDIREVI